MMAIFYSWMVNIGVVNVLKLNVIGTPNMPKNEKGLGHYYICSYCDMWVGDVMQEFCTDVCGHTHTRTICWDCSIKKRGPQNLNKR